MSAARRAQRFAQSWVGLYTRGLDERIAGDRQDEIASDLADHFAYSRDAGIPQESYASEVRVRTMLGIPADLLWRRHHLERRYGDAYEHYSLSVRLLGLSATGAVLAAVLGVVASVQLARSAAAGTQWRIADETVSLGVGTLAVLCGILLIARARTRAVGMLWLAGATPVTLSAAYETLLYSSTTFPQLLMLVPYEAVLLQVVCAGAGLFYLGAALHARPDPLHQGGTT